MKYGKLSCIDFFSCSVQQCLSIDSFPSWTPNRGQKGPMNKVCLSFSPEVFLELFLWFFLQLSIVLGGHVAWPDFLKIKCLTTKRENWTKNGPNIGLFEYIYRKV